MRDRVGDVPRIYTFSLQNRIGVPELLIGSLQRLNGPGS